MHPQKMYGQVYLLKHPYKNKTQMYGNQQSECDLQGGYSKGQGEILLKSEWFPNPCQVEKTLGDCQIMLVGTEMTNSVWLME